MATLYRVTAPPGSERGEEGGEREREENTHTLSMLCKRERDLCTVRSTEPSSPQRHTEGLH